MENDKTVDKIDFKIDGLETDRGAVRLSVFRDKLDQLTKLLSDAERQAAHVKQAKSLFKLTDLNYSSAQTEITPIIEGDYDGSVKAVALLNDLISGINEQLESLGDVKSSIVKKVQDLCIGAGEKFKTQTLIIGGNRFVMDSTMAEKAQSYLDKKYVTYGEVKGKIERVNIHRRKEFCIYLDISGSAVDCHFRGEHLLDKVGAALGRTVIASGRLEFIGNDVEPVAANIDHIEIIPEDYAIPRRNDLFKLAPNLTGDMDIDDYIGSIRGGWERD